MIQKTNLAEPQNSIAYFFMGTGWYQLSFGSNSVSCVHLYQNSKKIFTLVPQQCSLNLTSLQISALKGKLMKSQSVFFFEQNIKLNTFGQWFYDHSTYLVIQKWQYSRIWCILSNWTNFPILPQKTKKKKNSIEISTIAVRPSWSLAWHN